MEHPLKHFIESAEFKSYYSQIGDVSEYDIFRQSVDRLCPGCEGLGYLFRVFSPLVNLGAYAPDIRLDSNDVLGGNPLDFIEHNREVLRYRYEILNVSQAASEMMQIGFSLGRMVGTLNSMNVDARHLDPNSKLLTLFDLIVSGCLVNPASVSLFLNDLLFCEQLALIGYMDTSPDLKFNILESMKNTRVEYIAFKARYAETDKLPNLPKMAAKAVVENKKAEPKLPVDFSQLNIKDIIKSIEKDFKNP